MKLKIDLSSDVHPIFQEKINEFLTQYAGKYMQNEKPSHTPGPWLVGIKKGIDTSNDKCKVFAKNDSFFAIVDGTKNYSEAIANAALIAASPEMLDALETILFAVTDDLTNSGKIDRNAIEDLCKQAIAKARGDKMHNLDNCPKCKSTNIANEGPEPEYTCHDCSYQWSEN
jgi:hypothetical protein